MTVMLTPNVADSVVGVVGVIVSALITGLVAVYTNASTGRAQRREMENQQERELIAKWKEIVENQDARIEATERRATTTEERAETAEKRAETAERKACEAAERAERAEAARQVERREHNRFRSVAAEAVAALIDHINRRLGPPAPSLPTGWPSDLPIPTPKD